VLLDLQRDFRRTVTGREDVIAGAVRAAHGSLPGRINVYRNTVQQSLIDVLAAAFPVVQRIVGLRFFAALARDYAVSHLPEAPQLSLYGGGLADFIAGHDKTGALPYLADVARLEWARGEAYFAADAAPLDPAALSKLTPEQLSALRFVLHPAARLVRSAFPIHRIWTVNQPAVADVPAVDMSLAENVVFTRPAYDVQMRLVSAADAAFIAACAGGSSLNDATVAALAVDGEFNLQDALQRHFIHGTFGMIRAA